MVHGPRLTQVAPPDAYFLLWEIISESKLGRTRLPSLSSHRKPCQASNSLLTSYLLDLSKSY